jgi:hypothetical protein
MNELDQMLDAPSEMALPPLVRWCKQRKDAGDKIEVELYRPDEGAGLSGTELVIHSGKQGNAQAPTQVEWDDGVNAALVEVGIRAVDLRQEGERFALALRAGLRKVERRYGDGYLNAVLVDLLDESDLCRNGEIAEVRKYVQVNRPDRSGRSYSPCREAIASEIGARAVELRDKLKYSPDELRAVMTKALAIYLDERFSVSSRRRFGLLA